MTWRWWLVLGFLGAVLVLLVVVMWAGMKAGADADRRRGWDE
jgi:hypothetical protein